MDELLTSNIVGRLGCNDGKKMYVIPINYYFNGKNIIAHSAPGTKINIMRQNPQVCFEIDEMENLANWKSVIVWGEYQELTEERDRYYAMKGFVDRMMHIKISETAKPPEISGERVHPHAPQNIRPVIYRIIITEKTGRFEKS